MSDNDKHQPLSDQQIETLRALVAKLRREAEPVGPLHAHWDSIIDAEELIAGRMQKHWGSPQKHYDFLTDIYPPQEPVAEDKTPAATTLDKILQSLTRIERALEQIAAGPREPNSNISYGSCSVVELKADGSESHEVIIGSGAGGNHQPPPGGGDFVDMKIENMKMSTVHVGPVEPGIKGGRGSAGLKIPTNWQPPEYDLENGTAADRPAPQQHPDTGVDGGPGSDGKP